MRLYDRIAFALVSTLEDKEVPFRDVLEIIEDFECEWDNRITVTCRKEAFDKASLVELGFEDFLAVVSVWTEEYPQKATRLLREVFRSASPTSRKVALSEANTNDVIDAIPLVIRTLLLQDKSETKPQPTLNRDVELTTLKLRRDYDGLWRGIAPELFGFVHDDTELRKRWSSFQHPSDEATSFLVEAVREAILLTACTGRAAELACNGRNQEFEEEQDEDLMAHLHALPTDADQVNSLAAGMDAGEFATHAIAAVGKRPFIDRTWGDKLPLASKSRVTFFAESVVSIHDGIPEEPYVTLMSRNHEGVTHYALVSEDCPYSGQRFFVGPNAVTFRADGGLEISGRLAKLETEVAM